MKIFSPLFFVFFTIVQICSAQITQPPIDSNFDYDNGYVKIKLRDHDVLVKVLMKINDGHSSGSDHIRTLSLQCSNNGSNSGLANIISITQGNISSAPSGAVEFDISGPGEDDFYYIIETDENHGSVHDVAKVEELDYGAENIDYIYLAFKYVPQSSVWNKNLKFEYDLDFFINWGGRLMVHQIMKGKLF